MSYAKSMPRPVAPADAELAAGLRNGVTRLARRLRAQRGENSPTLSQMSALSTLERCGPLAPGALAAQERVQPPSMTRIVAALTAAGLVARTDHPVDRRQVLLAPTPAGRALLSEDRRRRDAWLAAQLASLSDDERAALARALPVLDRLGQA